MASYLFWEFIILIASIWLMIILFAFYGWLLLKYQKRMMSDFLKIVEKREPDSEEKEEAPSVHLEISKDEPLSKYQNLNPDDQVDVSFVDTNE